MAAGSKTSTALTIHFLQSLKGFITPEHPCQPGIQYSAFLLLCLCSGSGQHTHHTVMARLHGMLLGTPCLASHAFPSSLLVPWTEVIRGSKQQCLDLGSCKVTTVTMGAGNRSKVGVKSLFSVAVKCLRDQRDSRTLCCSWKERHRLPQPPTQLHCVPCRMAHFHFKIKAILTLS